MSYTRIDSFDSLKIILIFFVIIIHLLPYKFEQYSITVISNIIHGFGRVIVPIFFILSGYFYNISAQKENYSIKKRLLSLFRIFIVWQIIYSYFTYIFFKNNVFTIEDIILIFVYGFGHIWFLHALILGLLLTHITRKLNINLKILLAISLILIGYTFQFLHITKSLTNEWEYIYKWIGTSRNFLFFGYPYLMLGSIINQLVFKHNKYIIGFLILANILESLVYLNFSIEISNLYITSIPLSIALFMYIKKVKISLPFKLNPKFLLATYLIQFYPIYYFTIKFSSNTPGYVLLKIILVSGSTFILFYLLNKIDKKIKILF